MNVQQALAEVAKEMSAVGKNERMETGQARYNYRSLDDLVNAVHPLLAKHGVTFVPSGVSVVNELEKTTKSGSIQYQIRAVVSYTIYGPEGDFVTSSVLAEGADSGDKAGNKVMSGAYKYVISQVLSVAYSMEDQDATPSDPVAESAIIKGRNGKPRPTPKQQDSNAAQRLLVASEKLGMPVEQITEKYRKSNGDLSMLDFFALPATRLNGFLRQVEEEVKKREALAQSEGK